MSINKAIADAIRAYPTLYQCRTDVLHQWFCVIGNGMSWKNGRLVNNYLENPRSLQEIIEFKTEFLRNSESVNETVDAETRAKIAKIASELTYTYDNADDLALVSWCSDFPADSIYPLCEYSKMNTVPDDVDPEYLAAVREMIFAVFESKDIVGSFRRAPEQNEIAMKKIRDFASNVLSSLATRFGDAGMPTSYEEWVEKKNAAKQRVSDFMAKIGGM